MFSYFENGIKQVFPTKNIHLNQVVQITRNNPKIHLINELRELRNQGNIEYKLKKQNLSYITPACIVQKRELKPSINFERNFISSSGLIYLDIDLNDITLVKSYKDYLVSTYGHLISFCGISASYGGVSVIVTVNADIYSPQSYTNCWRFLVENIFHTEKIDNSTSDIGRAMFLSSDPDVFVNYNSVFDLQSAQLDTFVLEDNNLYTNTRSKQNKEKIRSCDKDSPCENSLSDLKWLRRSTEHKIIYKSEIEVKNNIVDIEERDYTELYFNRNIPDTKKHRYYTSIIHKFMHLNPHADKSDLLAYLYELNKHQNPRMTDRRLKEIVNFQWDLIHNDDYEYISNKKHVFFSKDCGLTKYHKIRIANEATARRRMNKSIRIIQDTKSIMLENGLRITKSSVARESGLSRTTVHKYWDMDEVDMKEVERYFNEVELKFPYQRAPNQVQKKQKKSTEG
jgi:hypothetical protein